MTQQLLADRAGVSLSYIEKLERGGTRQPSVGTLTAIAAALNVPLDTLLHHGPRQPAPAQPRSRMHAPASAGYRTLHAMVLRHMEQHGMSLRALAQAIDQDPSTLSRQLRGIKPCGPRLARLIDHAFNANGEIIQAAREAEAAPRPMFSRLTAGAQPAAAAASATRPEPATARAEPATLAPTASRGPERGDRKQPHPSVISAMLAEATSGRTPADTEPLALILTGSAASALSPGAWHAARYQRAGVGGG